LLRRCLAKDRQQRLQDIGDARIEISEALASPGDRATVAAGLPLAHRRLVPWALGVLVGMLIAGFALWNLKPSSPTVAQVPAQVAISLPPGDRLVTQNLPPHRRFAWRDIRGICCDPRRHPAASPASLGQPGSQAYPWDRRREYFRGQAPKPRN